ncbi:hypothetical protein RJ639_024226 [Escallonia herrerae]|uniref:Chalcone/stilbene synthase N-terminal domain-containing protein n=1 Tax=Escallonia herrerae TaxID=1293975 RepID=A0AA88V1D4_9ASTE|nr:hypothetical protein RJ639_024226 [Escallonia herrerae]
MIYQHGYFAGGTILRLAKDLAENNAGACVLVVCSADHSRLFCGLDRVLSRGGGDIGFKRLAIRAELTKKWIPVAMVRVEVVKEGVWGQRGRTTSGSGDDSGYELAVCSGGEEVRR